MTRTTSISLLAAALALLVSACGGDSGEDARESASNAVVKTQEVASETSKAISESAERISDKVKANTDEGWASIKANWTDWTESLQSQFDELSVDDVIGTEGERQELIALIQEKYQLTRIKAAQKLDEWQAKASAEMAAEQ